MAFHTPNQLKTPSLVQLASSSDPIAFAEQLLRQDQDVLDIFFPILAHKAPGLLRGTPDDKEILYQDIL